MLSDDPGGRKKHVTIFLCMLRSSLLPFRLGPGLPKSAHMTAKAAKKKQHRDFASGHPRHYYPGPSVLIFSKRNGIRRSTLVWPFLTHRRRPEFRMGLRPLWEFDSVAID